MKGRAILLGDLAGRQAAALIEDGEMADFLIDGDPPRLGTIYRAIAERPVKGQGGLFLRTPDGRAFLRQIGGLAPGRPVLVQVSGYAEPGKAVPVVPRLLFKGRHAIVTPGAPGINVSRAIRDPDRRDGLGVLGRQAMPATDMGLILRSACEAADDATVVADIRRMTDLARSVLAAADGAEPERLCDGDGPHALARREWPEPAQWAEGAAAFAAFGVPEDLARLRDPQVPLPGGGGLFVEPTRALVAVDVNTGADTSPASGLKANLAAARELPRQLRLRGLGGQIVLDLAPMPKKHRPSVESALRAAFRRDGVETALVGWTPLGHYELQRKRDRVSPLPYLP